MLMTSSTRCPRLLPRSASILAALLAFVVLLAAATPAFAQTSGVAITEVVASNGGSRTDQDGEEHDWIELHNFGTQAVDIGGYYLTDRATNTDKWAFPKPTLLAPGAYLVVFASDKDRAVSGRELHANFRLSATGEYLGLYLPDGRTMVSELRPGYPAQFVDTAYGRRVVAGNWTSEWCYHDVPTPGALNTGGSSVVLSSKHTPARPKASDDVVVEIEIAHPNGGRTTGVTFQYRVDFQSDVTAQIRDDGQGRDRVAGDDIWTAVIPATAHRAGQMLRWKVFSFVTPFAVVSGPRNKSSDSPAYYGTMIEDPSVTSQLPVLHWFVRSPSAARTDSGTRCSIYYDGVLYDNVFVRRRGGTSAGWNKRSFKLDFNQGHHLRFYSGQDPVEELNLNTTYSDKAFVRQTLAAEVFRDSGSTYSKSPPVHVRQNGSFYSVAIAVEQVDERFLDRFGLDRLGALYKMFNTLDRSRSRVEKKTRHWETNNADLGALVAGVRGSGATLERYLFDNIDVPAVISYLVANVLTHDNDNVHKNHYLYRDTRGDGEWRFVPWDKDLTFGRNFDGRAVLNDQIWARRDPQSHPLYGDRSHRKVDGFWNRLIDACHRTPRLRAMFLRRLRTVMQRVLQAPGTPRAQLLLEQRIDALARQMGADVAQDQRRWGVPGYGNRGYTFSVALGRLEREYLSVRRQHFFQTHGSGSNALIPPAATGNERVHFGVMLASPLSGNSDDEYIELLNCSSTAIDVSGWTMSGGVRLTLPAGTVIEAQGVLYVAKDVASFRRRARSPRGGEGYFVVGGYDGKLAPGELVVLRNARNVEVARRGGIDFVLATSGVGDMRVTIDRAPPSSELFTFMSVTSTSGRLGCGPWFGVGLDSVWAAGLPLGSAPFRVRADANGRYSWTAPPNTLPRGLTVDSFCAAIPLSGPIAFSQVRRVRF